MSKRSRRIRIGNKPPADRVRYVTSRQLLALSEPSFFGPPQIPARIARRLCGFKWPTRGFFRDRGGWSDHGFQGERECARRRRQRPWLNETAAHQR